MSDYLTNEQVDALMKDITNLRVDTAIKVLNIADKYEIDELETLRLFLNNYEEPFEKALAETKKEGNK